MVMKDQIILVIWMINPQNPHLHPWDHPWGLPHHLQCTWKKLGYHIHLKYNVTWMIGGQTCGQRLFTSQRCWLLGDILSSHMLWVYSFNVHSSGTWKLIHHQFRCQDSIPLWEIKQRNLYETTQGFHHPRTRQQSHVPMLCIVWP